MIHWRGQSPFNLEVLFFAALDASDCYCFDQVVYVPSLYRADVLKQLHHTMRFCILRQIIYCKHGEQKKSAAINRRSEQKWQLF